MERSRYYPDEEELVLVGGAAQDVTFRGPQVPGFPFYRLDFVATDETLAQGGAAVQDLQVMVVPRYRTDALGGAVYHTLAAVATPNTNNRHQLPCGAILKAGEDVVVTALSATGGTFRIRLERTLLSREAVGE